MTPQFYVNSFESKISDKIPHYKICGKISDDDFVLCPCVSLSEFILGKNDIRLPISVRIEEDSTNRFDERTAEFFTGKKSDIYPSKIVWQDRSLALMREQAKQSLIVTAQRKLFKELRFQFLDAISMLFECQIEHNNTNEVATPQLKSVMENAVDKGLVQLEFEDLELGYYVYIYTKPNRRLNNVKLIIEVDLTTNYFLISAYSSSINIRIDARIAIARHLQEISQSSKYFDLTRKTMLSAAAGIGDKYIAIKDHAKHRFVTNSDVALTTMLKTGEDPNQKDERIHIFKDYQEAWIFAFKYVTDPDIVIGYVNNH